MITCSHCDSRWESKFTFTHCPFCGAPLAEDPATLSTVPQVIAYAIRQKGRDFVATAKFCGYFSDIAPQFSKETRLIRIAVESGAYGAILKSSNRAQCLGVEKQKLCQNFFMDEQWSESVLRWLVDALEDKPISGFGKTPPEKAPKVPKAPPPAPTLQDRDGFTFNGTTLIYYKGTQGNVVIPSEVTAIGIGAFMFNKHIRTVTLPDSVTQIHNEAFRGCTNLTNIQFGNCLRYIGEKTFQDCANLRELHIPNSVTEVGEYAFSGCASLTEVWLSTGITNHPLSVFHNCTKLRKFSYTP